MRRIRGFFLFVTAIVFMFFFISGCSNTNKVQILTRAEWINEITNTFGLEECYDTNPIFSDVQNDNKFFEQIQSCAEWKIIEGEGLFNPDKRADVDFAIITSIKAIGLDKIEKSVNGIKLDTNEAIIKYFNDNSSMKYISGSALYKDVAADIIQNMSRIYRDLGMKQYQDIKYTQSVIEMNDQNVSFSADGETAVVKDVQVKMGDIIVVEPSANIPSGKYAKVTSVDGNKIEYVEPELEEILEHVTIYGTYTPEILGVVPLMDGVEVEAIDNIGVKPQIYKGLGQAKQMIYVKDKPGSLNAIPVADTYSFGDIELKINATAKEGDTSIEISGAVKVKDIKTTIDVDVWGPIVKEANISVSNTIEARISTSGKLEKDFKLAKIPCKLYGIIGVDFVLGAKVGLDGSVSLVWSVDTFESLEYKPFSMPKFNAQGMNPGWDAELKAKVYFKPEFKAEFVIGPASLASIGAYSGVEASVKVESSEVEKEIDCIDVNAHIPLAIFIGADTKKGDDTLLGKLGVKKTWIIWSSATSPVKKKWHIEDGKIVDKCTKGDKDSKSDKDNTDDKGDKDSAQTGDDNAASEIDRELIENIMNWDENLIISSYYVALDEGQQDTLKVNFIPESYSRENITYSSTDSSVVSVDQDGNLTAIKQGSSIIKVSTIDGKYVQYCAVRVLASYAVEFTPL